MKLNKKIIFIGLIGTLLLSGCGVDRVETSDKFAERFKKVIGKGGIDYLVDKKNDNMYILYTEGTGLNGVSPFLDENGIIIKYHDFEKGLK